MYIMDNFNIDESLPILSYNFVKNKISKSKVLRNIFKDYICKHFTNEQDAKLIEDNTINLEIDFDHIINEIDLVIPSNIYLKETSGKLLNFFCEFNSVKFESDNIQLFKIGEYFNNCPLTKSEIKNIKINKKMVENLDRFRIDTDNYIQSLPTGSLKNSLNYTLDLIELIFSSCEVYD